VPAELAVLGLVTGIVELVSGLLASAGVVDLLALRGGDDGDFVVLAAVGTAGVGDRVDV
jgi:hypothetical protein